MYQSLIKITQYNYAFKIKAITYTKTSTPAKQNHVPLIINNI